MKSFVLKYLFVLFLVSFFASFCLSACNSSDSANAIKTVENYIDTVQKSDFKEMGKYACSKEEINASLEFLTETKIYLHSIKYIQEITREEPLRFGEVAISGCRLVVVQSNWGPGCLLVIKTPEGWRTLVSMQGIVWSYPLDNEGKNKIFNLLAQFCVSNEFYPEELEQVALSLKQKGSDFFSIGYVRLCSSFPANLYLGGVYGSRGERQKALKYFANLFYLRDKNHFLLMKKFRWVERKIPEKYLSELWIHLKKDQKTKSSYLKSFLANR